MNILFVTEISTFPINGGEKIRSYSLIKMLNNICDNLTVILTNKENCDIDKFKQLYHLNNTSFIQYNKLKKNKTDILLKYFYKDKKLLKLIENIDLKKIDLVFIDYNFMGHYIDFFKRREIPVIYGTHNAQANLTKQENAKTLTDIIKKYINLFPQIIHERIYFKKADMLITVSEEDKEYHRGFIKKSIIYTIPNLLDFDLYDSGNNISQKEKYIVMSANFNSFQNFFGVKWFIENVWDSELDSIIKLKLVGKGSESLSKKINIKDYSNIELVGPVKDINEYIKKAYLSIVPLQHGSGSRLKCIEAMALKTTLISTEIGIEGIEHENNVLIASNADKFKLLILNSLKDLNEINDISERAFNIFIKKYTIQSIQNKFKSDIYTKIINVKNKR